MSVFDLFRKNPPQQQGQQPPQGQDGNNPHVTNNPTVPNSTNTPEHAELIRQGRKMYDLALLPEARLHQRLRERDVLNGS